MATIRREIRLKTPVVQVWDVLRDVGAVHTRLAPGFVVDTRMEEGARVVTFANGLVARELIVAVDEGARRIVYSVVGGSATHHNASFQAIPAASDQTTLVWITDVLPDAVAAPLTTMIDAGSNVIRRTLDSN